MSEKRYVWAVPISSVSPHRAHLILDVIRGDVAYALCAPHKVINTHFAVVVDSERYAHRCQYCTRAFSALGNGRVMLAIRPKVLVSSHITVARNAQA